MSERVPKGYMFNRADRSAFASRRYRDGTLALAWACVVAAAYFGAGRLGLLVSPAHSAIAVWPAAGVGMAAVVLGGRRMLAGVAIGGLAIGLSTGEPVGGALLAAVAWTIEPWLATHLLERVGFHKSLRRPGDIVAYVGLAGVISPAVAGVVGAISLLAAGWVEAPSLWQAWRDWWLADLSGVVAIGSVILILSGIRLRALRIRASADVVSMAVFVGVITWALLHYTGSLPYLVLPLLFVLAFVYGQRGAAVGILLVSSIATILTARGHGPFSTGGLDVGLIRLDIFLCVGNATALLVAAAQSERRRAEEAAARLAASESALAEAQALARVGSFYMDLLERRTTWSRELYRILGQDPDSFTPDARAWRECVHPEDREEIERAFRSIYAGAAGLSIEHRIIRADGEVRTVEAHLRSEVDADGQLVRIVGTCQDITGRKLVEERFRQLFEDAPYPIVVFDGIGHIQLSNLRAQTLFGFTQNQLLGLPVERLVLTPGSGGVPWYQTPADGGTSAVRDLELRGRRRDGSELAVEVSLTPLVTAEGVMVSAAIRDVTQVREAAETLTFQARHDSLTGLPNRMQFLELLEVTLERARHSGRPLAVIFLDLDNFKVVNDTRGHDVGDALLRELTPLLGAAVRNGDTVGRLGGDEFVVLCESLPDEGRAIEIAERLVGVTDQPIVAGGFEHAVSLSAGVVIVREAGRVSARGLLRDADAAMYAAKEGGKGRLAVFDETMHEHLMERLEVEASLRGAQDRGELALFYQPVVELQSHRVVAVEALLRWRHPARGLLAPAQFLPVAESTGLIEGIGDWVIEEACRQAAQWRDLSAPHEPVPVSVNVSAHQLATSGLPRSVERALGRSQLGSELLMLEVTEAALLQDMSSARRELAQLKDLGVRLIVDDFGAGYSSLPALRELMVDGLKLDRSFVQALVAEDGVDDDGAMVGAVLSMAGALDAHVIAEGVETWAQVSRLRDHGCDYAQGYLFAPPRPAVDLTPMLLRGPVHEPSEDSPAGGGVAELDGLAPAQG